MGQITGLAEIVFWVQDMQKSLAFYRDLLGFEVISPASSIPTGPAPTSRTRFACVSSLYAAR